MRFLENGVDEVGVMVYNRGMDIRKAIDDYGINGFARLVELTASTVNDIRKRSVGSMKTSSLIHIARQLNVSPESILEDSCAPEKAQGQSIDAVFASAGFDKPPRPQRNMYRYYKTAVSDSLLSEEALNSAICSAVMFRGKEVHINNALRCGLSDEDIKKIQGFTDKEYIEYLSCVYDCIKRIAVVGVRK